MKTSVILPVHSFVDVITNSSSEIFVAADQNTVKAIKKLVDNIISASAFGNDAVNAELPAADDLFTFELVTLCYDENCDEVYLTASEVKKKRKELDEITDNPDKHTEQLVEAAELWEFRDDENGYPVTSVRIEVKDKTNKSAVAAAKVLSNLTGIFNIEATYN